MSSFSLVSMLLILQGLRARDSSAAVLQQVLQQLKVPYLAPPRARSMKRQVSVRSSRKKPSASDLAARRSAAVGEGSPAASPVAGSRLSSSA